MKTRLSVLSLAFVFSACTGNIKSAPNIDLAETEPRKTENVQAIDSNQKFVSDMAENRIKFLNFPDDQLAYIDQSRLLTELDKMGYKENHWRQLESGHRVFLAKGTSVKTVCRSYFGTYNHSQKSPKQDPNYSLKNIEFGVLIEETNHNSPIYILTQDYGQGCNEDVVSTETETQFFLSSFSKVRMTEAVVTLHENESVHFAERPRKRPL